ncbi:hypothetical protein JR316_0009898 [Psilocybe cubensis]|uniref:RNase III domain-containing protein n=2 Tax=Psilocybe cubensis TaxID=181762 RepID=A0A8H8CFP2_PSICU|nr:hypothetical protein JR316_0009898 [Psilocybe cubensis]KAH9477672.1 hypothetical protein JR316_0009898 [Psilocybe cubensis]
MSSATRCLSSSLRVATSAHSSSSLACGRALTLGTRSYGQAAVEQQDPSRKQSNSIPRRIPAVKFASKLWRQHGPRSPNEAPQTSKSAESQESQVPPHFAEYMNRIFSPLQFPPELAQRVLTHNSHALARRGHNAGLSFIGRRVLSTYLLFFLESSSNLTPSHNTEEIISTTLHTNLLGEHVGHAWGVGKVLIWQPAAPLHDLSPLNATALRGAGLYKVQGEAVQAMIGAIYQQHGAAAALNVFHSHLLPLLRVKGGLPAAFHQDVRMVSRKIRQTQQIEAAEAETPVKVET